jgi:hypothetical protein
MIFSRKAQVQLPFNLIFSIIAGSIILLVIGVFVLRSIEINKKENAIEMVTNLNLIMSGAEASSKTINHIEDLPNLEVDIDSQGFSILGQERPWRNRLVFAPKRLEGTRLITWSYDWRVPFYVSNFLYLTTPKEEYVFECVKRGDTVCTEKFEQVLPSKYLNRIGPEFGVDSNRISSDKVKIVIINREETISIIAHTSNIDQDSLNGKDVSYLKLIFTEEDMSRGKYRFCSSISDCNSVNGLNDFVGLSMALALIFSEDENHFNTMKNKAIKRMNRIADIYKERTEMLQGNAALQTNCGYNPSLWDKFTNNNLPSKPDIENLIKENEKFQRKSCPLIY